MCDLELFSEIRSQFMKKKVCVPEVMQKLRRDLQKCFTE